MAALLHLLRNLCVLCVWLPVLALLACPAAHALGPFGALPRNMDLKAFDPHRKDFACKHEADVLPPIQPEAEALFQRGLMLTSYGTPKAQRNPVEAVRLWQQAMEMSHWKALINLANLYINGYVDPLEVGGKRRLQDVERGVKLIEEGMRAGIPSAFDFMGTLHNEGLGVKGNASRAWAFWELAADMGSAKAQGYIGAHLMGGYNNPQELMWANKPVGIKMQECAIAQGDGKAAYEFGTWLEVIGIDKKPDYARALRILHDGVKWGSDKCADALTVAFSAGRPLVNGTSDKARSERYSTLGTAIRYSGGDLRFPNLDKVLPLPPAQLPKWDGDEDTLIDAAKAVQPLPPPKPTPASRRSGRAYMPDGLMLAGNPQPPAAEVQALPYAQREAFRGAVASQLTGTPAAFSGYWQPQWHNAAREHELAFNRQAVPLRFQQGETFDVAELSGIPKGVRPPLHWHYLGLPVAVPAQPPHPKVLQGIARPSRQPVPAVQCDGRQPCPRTGIWMAQLLATHARAAEFNTQLKQAYLEQGQPFPAPRQMQAPPDTDELTWVWMDNANDIGFAGFADLTLTDLHDGEGNPLV